MIPEVKNTIEENIILKDFLKCNNVTKLGVVNLKVF